MASNYKTVLVTGGAQGIGKAIVERLVAQPNTKVIVIDKQKTSFIEKCEDQYKNRIKFYLQDIAERQNLSKILNNIKRETIDGIVNNAGEVFLENWDELKMDTWDRTLAVNVTAPLQIVYELKESLSKGGSIINIASVDGMWAAFTTVAYAVSKAGLINLTKSLAAILGPKNIRVNAIAPGWVETEMTKDTMPDESKWMTPLGRNAHPSEIAEVVEFLLSERASFINAQTIIVDGGLTSIDYTLKKESER